MGTWVRTFEEAPEIPYIRRERFASRWWRWRSLLRLVGAVLALAVMGGGGYVFSQRNVATKVTVDDAVGAFRAKTRTAPAEATRDRGVDGPVAGRVAASRREPTQAASSVPRSASRAQNAGPKPYVLPPEGVYTYRTSGGESVSIAGAHHDYPSESTATVRHLGGCRWHVEFNVIEEHKDILDLCSRTDEFSQSSQARWVSFFGKRDGQEFTFSPPALVSDATEPVGARSEATGKGDQRGDVHLVRTYLGRESISIDGRTVETVRLHIAGTATGKQRGSSVDDLWLDPMSGMPIRWERSVDAIADATFGARVHYKENAKFNLVSLRPRT
jgi:hypothetical protein